MSDKAQGLPKGWADLAIGDACEVRSGIGFPKEMQGRPAGDVPFAKVRDISEAWQAGRRELTGASHYVRQAEVAELRATPMPAGTVVMAKIGEAVRLNRRAILAQPSLVDNNVMGWVPDRDLVSSEYLYYFSLSLPLEALTRATTVPSLRKSDVERLPLRLPPVEEQHRLVELLDAHFARIADGQTGLRRAQSGLTMFKAACLGAAFSGQLLGVPEPPATPLAELADIQSGLAKGRPDTGPHDEVPYLRTANVQGGYLDLDVMKTLPVTEVQRAKHRLQHEDVLVLEGGDADKVGRGWLWESQLEECLHQNHVFAVRTNRGRLVPQFLAHYINAPQARTYFLGCAKQTTNLASINKRQLRELPVPTMPLAAQNEVVQLLNAQLSAVKATASSLDQQARRAEQLKAAVLHQALTGALSETPVEESANKRRAVLVGEYS